MAKISEIPIKGLEIDEIRNNLIEYLKSRSDANSEFSYTDYNFDGSGIRTLIDLLSTNAHMIGFYVKMVMNESFIDSAVLRDSLLSKAKLNGYLPKSKRSSRTDVQIKAIIDENQDNFHRTMTIERGCFCTGQNADNDTRKYYIIDPVVVYSENRFTHETDPDVPAGKVSYVTPPITVYEGNFEVWRFKKNDELKNERFIIPDINIDIDTIRVLVKQTKNSVNYDVYKRADKISEVNYDSLVYYISTSANGYYEIFFGNDKIGKKPPHNHIIEISYVSTHGAKGNGCKKMGFIDVNDTGRTYTVLDGFNPTAEGADEESIEDIRFNIPNHFRRQERLVTKSDYRSFLLNEFKNIESINVWGGEENLFKDYNSIYISAKPKGAKKLSGVTVKEIEEKINKYQVAGRKIKIIEPHYINVNVELFASYNTQTTTRTSNEIANLIVLKARDYANKKLNRFNNNFSNVDFLDFIRDEISEIISIHSMKSFYKKYDFVFQKNTYHNIIFGNKIVEGNSYSSTITFENKTCYIKDEAKNLYLYNKETDKKVINSPIGSIDYETGTFSLYLSFDFEPTEQVSDVSTIYFYAKPKYNDIKTTLNNIIILEDIKVNMENV